MDAAEKEIPLYVEVLQEAKRRYTNLRLAYLSSRIYGGYIPDADSEPNAYQHGFAMKWVIEEQIQGSAELDPDSSDGSSMAPWISWGPYLWADGLVPREDGLVWECDDVASDGVHPSESGQTKVAGLLMEHFRSDPTSTGWFIGDGVIAVSPATTTTTVSPSETTASNEASLTTATSRSEGYVGPQATTDGNRNQPSSTSWWPLLVAALVGAAVAAIVTAVVLHRQAVLAPRPQQNEGVDG
ncbi:MAG TPA: hypothetical protein VM848_16840 [Acidimicrobiia bacterium]|nr:hypothetical protein [Acidimicrobiia bacterium]